MSLVVDWGNNSAVVPIVVGWVGRASSCVWLRGFAEVLGGGFGIEVQFFLQVGHQISSSEFFSGEVREFGNSKSSTWVEFLRFLSSGQRLLEDVESSGFFSGGFIDLVELGLELFELSSGKCFVIKKKLQLSTFEHLNIK